MSLRQALGADVCRVRDLLERLLDREDAIVMLIDGERAISYGKGFGLSPSQLEFVTNEIEHMVRGVAGRPRSRRKGGPRDRPGRPPGGGSRGGTGEVAA